MPIIKNYKLTIFGDNSLSLLQEQTLNNSDKIHLKQTDAQEEQQMVKYALEYARKGWQVIPLHTPDDEKVCSCNKRECKHPGKHPRTMRGLMDGTTNEEKILEWWEMWPEANIGIVTGEASGIIALDIDPRHKGDQSFAALATDFGSIPDTTTATTGGGGQHLLFAHPGARVKSFSSTEEKPGPLGAGIDVRGDGGYIVAPPSRHASGSLYTWKDKASLSPIPQWLLQKLTQPKKTQQTTHKETPRQAKESGFHSWDELNAELRRRIVEHSTAKLNSRGIYDCAGICHGSEEGTALMCNLETRAVKCNAGCSHEEILRAFSLPEKPDAVLGVVKATNTWNNLGEFLDMDFPTVEEVMKYIERGAVAQFAAATGVGKTTLLLNASIALAAGQSFPPLVPEASKPKKVLYVDFETSRGKMKEGILKMVSQEPYNWPVERRLVRENMKLIIDEEINDAPLNLSIPEHLSYIQKVAQEFGAELIVIDNTSAGFELDSENDNAEVASTVMLPLKHLARRTNAAVVLVHHTGKPGESPRQTIDAFMGRGASAFGSLARTIFGIVRATDLGEDYIVLHNTKNKNGPKLDPVTMKLKRDILWFQQVSQNPRTEVTADAVLEFVRKRGGATAAEIKEHFMRYGVSERTISRRTKDAEELELISRKNQKAKYRVVDKLYQAESEEVMDCTTYPC